MHTIRVRMYGMSSGDIETWCTGILLIKNNDVLTSLQIYTDTKAVYAEQF